MSLAVVAASLFTLTGVLPARAAWVDTFDGGFDQTWTFVAYDTALNTVGNLPDAGATFSAGVVSDQLTSQRYPFA